MTTKLRNFTPLDDGLCRDFGLTYAAVIGIMWRWQDMNGACQLSQQAIADRLGIKDRGTVAAAQREGVVRGHLIDLTPGLRNVAHTYKVSGLTVRIEMATVVDNGAGNSSTETDGAGNSSSVVREIPAPRCGKNPHEETLRDIPETNNKAEEENLKRKANADAIRDRIAKNKAAGKGTLDALLDFGAPPKDTLAWEAVGIFESNFGVHLGRSNETLDFGRWLHGEIMKGVSVGDFRAYIVADEFRMQQVAYWNTAYTGWANKIKGHWASFVLANGPASSGPTKELA